MPPARLTPGEESQSPGGPAPPAPTLRLAGPRVDGFASPRGPTRLFLGRAWAPRPVTPLPPPVWTWSGRVRKPSCTLRTLSLSSRLSPLGSGLRADVVDPHPSLRLRRDAGHAGREVATWRFQAQADFPFKPNFRGESLKFPFPVSAGRAATRAAGLGGCRERPPAAGRSGFPGSVSAAR